MSVKGISSAATYQAAVSNTTAKQAEQAKTTQIQGRTLALENEIKSIEEMFRPINENQEKDLKDSKEESKVHSREASNEALKKAVSVLNKQLSYTEAQYGYQEATNRVVIKIVDRETDEVLREVPPEKTLEMIAKVWELAGMLVDEKL